MKTKRWPQSEVELAAAAVDWLRSEGWTVYQEIETVALNRIADIVAVLDQTYWVLECKTSFGLDVIAQANRWKGLAQMVSVVVPGHRCRYETSRLAARLCKDLGIGVLPFDQGFMGEGHRIVRYARVDPVIDGKALTEHFEKALTPLHQDYAQAGNSNGKRLTKFRLTALQVIRVVNENPGIGMKELLSLVDHHYSRDAGFKAQIPVHIERGIIEGLEARKEGGKWRFYPLEEAA